MSKRKITVLSKDTTDKVNIMLTAEKDVETDITTFRIQGVVRQLYN